MRLFGAIRRLHYRTFTLWPQFKAKAAWNGYSTDDALARLIERYLSRGFDDGHPEEKGKSAVGS